jgi:hypothetical protein
VEVRVLSTAPLEKFDVDLISFFALTPSPGAWVRE